MRFFFLFLKLKLSIKRRRFQDDIKQNTVNDLKDIPLSACRKRFQQWEIRWQRCIALRGDYLGGGDNVYLE